MFVLTFSWTIPIQLVVATVVLALVWRRFRTPSGPPLPPGPHPIPVLGNLPSCFSDYRTAFGAWAKEYGEVVNLRVMGKTVILLNSRRAITELLEKRTASSAGRQKLTMAHDLVGLKYMPSQVSDPVLHRTYRRIFATVFNPRASQAFWGIQTTQMRKLALRLLQSTAKYAADIDRATAAIAFLVAYGYDIEEEDPGLTSRIHNMMKLLMRLLTPGEFVVDIIPSLQKLPSWFPGTKWKDDAAKWRKNADEIVSTPVDRVRHEMATGKAKPSFTLTLLEGQDGKEYEETTIKWAAGAIHAAGADTSAAAILNFLVAMTFFPKVQAKAQQELDAIIGRDRLPTIEDRDKLPYCWALVQESLRWHPVGPLALPHVMVADEIFDGYLIPKGATVLANVWLMAKDETDFPSADDFKPERFLNEDGTPSSVAEQNVLFGFGFGRRICPGAYVAEATLFGAVTSILWSSVVSLPASSKGMRPSDVDYPKKPAIDRPVDFPIDVTSRFAGAGEMLRNSIAE